MTLGEIEKLFHQHQQLVFQIAFLLNLAIISILTIQIKACQAQFFLNSLHSKSFTCVGLTELIIG